MAKAGATRVDSDSASSSRPACGTSTMTRTSGARGSVRTNDNLPSGVWGWSVLASYLTILATRHLSSAVREYSGAWVRLPVGLTDTVLRHVCVNLGGGHVG